MMAAVLRPARESDIDDLARLVVGDAAQASTAAAMRLYSFRTVADAIAMQTVMIASTRSWEATTVADETGLVGLVLLGMGSAALTSEVLDFAREVYGDGFERFLTPRLAAQAAVQGAYPPRCLRVSEIHVTPEARGQGIGTALMEFATRRAVAEGASHVGLQTLTTNPARRAFEAWGFRVAATITDPQFEAFSGAAGYHLMLKAVE